MKLFAVIIFFRVLAAFLLVYLAVPLCAKLRRPTGDSSHAWNCAEWPEHLLAAFVQASFFAGALCVILGRWRMCLPGLTTVLCLGLVLFGIVRRFGNVESISIGWSWLLVLLKEETTSTLATPLTAWHEVSRRIPQAAKMFATLALVLLFFLVRGALEQTRFTFPESYARSISMANLNEGLPWQPDGSVAFLAPLLPFSGVGAASIVRFTGPLFLCTLALLLSFAIFKATRKPIYPTLALMVCVALAAIGLFQTGEAVPRTLACTYALAGGLLWLPKPLSAIMALLTAWMISPTDSSILIYSALMALATGVAFSRKVRWFSPGLTVFCCAAAILLLRPNVQAAVPAAAQYESAARNCLSIARQFAKNEWLIVSPSEELAFIIGQGWHLELSEVVSRYSATEVEKQAFRFPYPTPNIFFFVERRPLLSSSNQADAQAQWAYSPVESSDWATYLYKTQTGRNLLEYRAAELMAAYAKTHQNLSVYYQDQVLTIYHLQQTNPGA